MFAQIGLANPQQVREEFEKAGFSLRTVVEQKRTFTRQDLDGKLVGLYDYQLAQRAKGASGRSSARSARVPYHVALVGFIYTHKQLHGAI